MINTLADAVDNFLLQLPEVKSKDKVSWNKGGELYSLTCENNFKKSLFATYLNEEQLELKNKFIEIYDKSKSNKEYYAQCEKICIDNVFVNEKNIGCYVFIVMERIVPLINMVLDEKYVDSNLSSNRKKEKLLLNIMQAGECIKIINRDFSEINLFINNEEICVDQKNNTKLLLFDMVKNQIDTNNQVCELKDFMERIARGLKISLKVKLDFSSIEDFINDCKVKKEKVLEEENRYARKFKEYLELAKDNNPKAYTNLGYMYENGKGIDVDYEKALFWYKKGAEQNYAPAITNLAHIYQKGNGVEKDYKKAINYLRQAAKLKDSVAWFNLGIAYQKGKGVEKDLQEAMNCYKKAAKYGNNTAKIIYERLKLKYR